MHVWFTYFPLPLWAWWLRDLLMFCSGRNTHRCWRTHAHTLAIRRCAKKRRTSIKYSLCDYRTDILSFLLSLHMQHLTDSSPSLLTQLFFSLHPQGYGYRLKTWEQGQKRDYVLPGKTWCIIMCVTPLEQNVLAFKRCQSRRVTPSVGSVWGCSIRCDGPHSGLYTHALTHMLVVRYLGWNTVL